MSKIRAIPVAIGATAMALALAPSAAAAEATAACASYAVSGGPSFVYAPGDFEEVTLKTDLGTITFRDVAAGQYLDAEGGTILSMTKCVAAPPNDEPANEEPAIELVIEEPTPETEPTVGPTPEPTPNTQPTPEPEVAPETEPEPEATVAPDPTPEADADPEDPAHDEPVVLGPEPQDQATPEAPRGESTAPQVRQETLAYTGAETPWLAGAGAALVLGGTALAWAGRRRASVGA